MYTISSYFDMSFEDETFDHKPSLIVLKKYRGLVPDKGSCDVVVEVFDGVLYRHPHTLEALDGLLVGVDCYGVGELSPYP